jgi:tetratricopeptide (TPR) repeat protein
MLACCLTLLPWSMSMAHAQGGLDRIHRRNGIDSGTITAIAALEVTISKGGVTSKIPSEEIRTITFAGEPADLNKARLATEGGKNREAHDILTSIDHQSIKREAIRQDYEFYSANCQARMAMSGQTDLEQATRQIVSFLSRHRTSYHMPAAIELHGDLLASANKPQAARKQYALLSKARSPIYKMRSALLVGRSYQIEGEHIQALAQFDQVLQAKATSEPGRQLHLAAQLGKAVSQAATGDAKSALEAVTQVISSAEPEDAQLQARAYNALGDCYKQSGNQKEALFAFLHVDLLYSKVSQEHAKALHELAQLWRELGHQSRARQATEQLTSQYPGSRWARE